MLWHVSEMLMTDFKARAPSRLNGFYLICKTLLLYICTCPYDDSLESHVEKQNLGEGTMKSLVPLALPLPPYILSLQIYFLVLDHFRLEIGLVFLVVLR